MNLGSPGLALEIWGAAHLHGPGFRRRLQASLSAAKLGARVGDIHLDEKALKGLIRAAVALDLKGKPRSG